MEAKILKLSRAVAILLLLLGVLYSMDEFLPPISEKTVVTEAGNMEDNAGNYSGSVVFANRSEIKTDRKILVPEVGSQAIVWYTPWFHGIKGAETSITEPGTGFEINQILGDPGKPRTTPLFITLLFLALNFVVLFSSRFEVSVGTVIFAIILAAVRFWVL